MTVTFTVTLRDKALKTIINILCKYFGLCICNCYCSLPLLFLSLQKVCCLHMTEEDYGCILQQKTIRLLLKLRCSCLVRLLRYFNVILSLTDEPDMCEPQQTGQNVRSLRCDDQALLMKWERAHRAKSLTAMLR